MERIRAAKDHGGRTLAFQLVNTMGSLLSLRNLPFHKMQSGAVSLIRQSGSIRDIATAICSRSNCAIGFVNQHRVVEGLCRAANSCKAGVVVGALRIACYRLCKAARFHTP